MRHRVGVGVFLSVLIMLSSVARAAPTTAPSDASGAKPVVVVFELKGALLESAGADDPFAALFGPPPVGLRDLLKNMRKAAEDENVKAVVILADSASVGSAQVEEVRQAMAEIRKAGKEIYVHSDSMSMGPYVLLSGASRISAAPTADLWIAWLYA